jgi:hypothetical protein
MNKLVEKPKKWRAMKDENIEGRASITTSGEAVGLGLASAKPPFLAMHCHFLGTL